MKRNVLITIRGGNIEDIFCNDVAINIHVIDYDNIQAGDEVDLSPFPVLYVLGSFKNFFIDKSETCKEIQEELKKYQL